MPEIEYVWDELSDNVIEEYEDGVLSVSYDHEPGLYGNLLSQNRNGVTSYYHYDGRGDTVALTDDSGNVTDTKEYDAWGNVVASTGSTVTPYQFVGRSGFQKDALIPDTFGEPAIYQSSQARRLSAGGIAASGIRNNYLYNKNTPVASDGITIVLNKLKRCPNRPDITYGLHEVRGCVAKLNGMVLKFRVLGLGCAADMMDNFLKGNQQDDPYCPFSCRQRLRVDPWVTASYLDVFDKGGDLNDPLLRECGQYHEQEYSASGTHSFGPPTVSSTFPRTIPPSVEDPIAQLDLFGGIGRVNYEFSAKHSVNCGARDLPCGCCNCISTVTAQWHMWDTFDIISSMPCPDSVAFPSIGIDMYPYFRCMAILENEAGNTEQVFGRPFKLDCRFWAQTSRRKIRC